MRSIHSANCVLRYIYLYVFRIGMAVRLGQYRRKMKISGQMIMINAEVLKLINKKGHIKLAIYNRKVAYFEHVIRRENIQKVI